MKKRILSAICAIAMLFGTVQTVFAADPIYTVNAQTNYDAYSDTYAVECYQYCTYDDGSGLKLNGDIYQGKHMTGSGYLNNYLIFKNMVFNSTGAGAIEVWTALDGDQSGLLEIRENGPDGTILATIPAYNNGSWTTPQKRIIEIADPSVFTGTKTLCIRWTNPIGNFYKFKFIGEWDRAEEPAISMRNAGDSTTDSISDAKTIIAGTKVVRNSNSADEKKGALILTQYNAAGSMIKKTVQEQSLPNGGGNQQWEIPDTKETDTTAVGAYFWKENGKKIYTKGTNKPFDYTSTAVASTSKIDAVVDGATVTVSGSEIDDKRVIIAVVPASYNATASIYSQAIQLYELPVTNGKYVYTYRMADGVATGDYKAFVFGDATTLEKQFKYTSPNEVYDILLYLSQTDKTDDEIIAKIKDNSGVFGVKSEFLNNMSATDKNIINTAIKNFYAQNPLSRIDVYDTWTNGLKNIILPQALISTIKTTTDVNCVVEILDTYADVLGIDTLPKYNDYKNGNKKQIARELMKTIDDNCVLSGFAQEFGEAVILGYFNSASSWGYIDEAICAYYAELPVSLTVYSRLLNSAKERFCNNFIDRDFASSADIVTLFNNLIPGYDTPENTTSDKYETLVITPSDEIYRYEIFVEKTEDPNDDFVVFDDLESVLWARRAILNMKYLGYVNGKTDTKFCPNDTITREEFTAILVRSFRLGESSPESLTFEDVDKNAWYAPFIATAVNYGIVNGVDDTHFGVGQNVTREQIAAMLQRAVAAVGKSIIPKKSLAAFIDSSYIADYAYPAVTELAKAEVVNGTGGGAFSPWKSATRAEAVVMISRLLENIK